MMDFIQQTLIGGNRYFRSIFHVNASKHTQQAYENFTPIITFYCRDFGDCDGYFRFQLQRLF